MAAWRADAAQAHRAERGRRAVEPRALFVQPRRLRLVGGREVRVDRLESQMRAREHGRQRPPQVVVPEPEPVHAGVDLQMTRAGARRARRPPRSSARAARRRRDRRRQPMREDAVEIADASAPNTRIGTVTPAVAQRHAFFDVRAREHRRAGRLERPADGGGAVPVGVGLDDRNDAGRRARRPAVACASSSARIGAQDWPGSRPRLTVATVGRTRSSLDVYCLAPSPGREVLESRVLLEEREAHRAGRAVALLADDELGDALGLGPPLAVDAGTCPRGR